MLLYHFPYIFVPYNYINYVQNICPPTKQLSWSFSVQKIWTWFFPEIKTKDVLSASKKQMENISYHSGLFS